MIAVSRFSPFPTEQIQNSSRLLTGSLPAVVPRLPRGALRLWPSILDRDALVPVHSLLLQGHPVQIPFLTGARALGLPQSLAGLVHSLVLAHQGALAPLALLASKEHPGAVDGPVSEVSVAGHAQRWGDAFRRQEGELPQHVDDLGVPDVLVPTPASAGGPSLG